MGEASHPGPPRLVIRMSGESSLRSGDVSTVPASDGAIRAVVGVFQPGESDTESMDGGATTPHQAGISKDDGAEMGSVVSRKDEVIVLPDPDVEVMLPGAAVFREAFRSLDEVNLVDHFSRRRPVMKSVPKVLTGPFRNSLRKLLLLLPRMLLHRPPGGGLLNKEKLLDRFKMFSRGEWLQPAEHATRRQRQPAIGDVKDLQMIWSVEQTQHCSWFRWPNCPPRGKLLRERRLHLVHTRLCKR